MQEAHYPVVGETYTTEEINDFLLDDIVDLRFIHNGKEGRIADVDTTHGIIYDRILDNAKWVFKGAGIENDVIFTYAQLNNEKNIDQLINIKDVSAPLGGDTVIGFLHK